MFLIVVFLLLFPVAICAQEGDIYYEKLKKELPDFATVLMFNQVEYTLPDDFTVLTTEPGGESLTFLRYPESKTFMYWLFCKLISNDSTVVTFIDIPPIYSKDSVYVEMNLAPFLKIPINRQHLVRVKGDFEINIGKRISSLKDCPITYCSHAYARRAFNADTVITYPLKVWEKYEGKYDRCQVTIIQKNGRGFIRLVSLYQRQEDLDRCLKAMEGMFWYRNPDEYLKFTEPEVSDTISVLK